MKAIAARAYLYLLLSLTSLLAGCNLDFALPANESMRLSIYKAGQPIFERTLGTNDPVRETISLWLAANPNDWEYTFITREPQIYVTGIIAIYRTFGCVQLNRRVNKLVFILCK